MYDFANSGYTTVVITAVFNAYFVGVVAGGADWATFAWTAALSVSYALIMLTAPLVGAYADAHAAKKKLLLLTTAGCVLGTALLGLAGPDDLWLACALIVVSNFFFGTGENVVAAFLPELAKGDALGKVSAWGWSLGYIGGLLTLAVCLAYVIWAEAHGYSAQQYVPVTMLITAAIFAAASLPTFLLLKERAVPQRNAQGTYVRAFARVGQTLRHARRYRRSRQLPGLHRPVPVRRAGRHRARSDLRAAGDALLDARHADADPGGQRHGRASAPCCSVRSRTGSDTGSPSPSRWRDGA